jgi:hypothetical protein
MRTSNLFGFLTDRDIHIAAYTHCKLLREMTVEESEGGPRHLLAARSTSVSSCRSQASSWRLIDNGERTCIIAVRNAFDATRRKRQAGVP